MIGDNWDHQKHTKDEKWTSHIMTCILVSKGVNTPVPSLPRIKDSTLPIDDMSQYDFNHSSENDKMVKNKLNEFIMCH